MPENIEDVRQWLLKTVQLVVDHSETAQVQAETSGANTTFLIKVSPGDAGKMIGKQGRTAQSLRVLARAMAKKLKAEFVIQIEDESGI